MLGRLQLHFLRTKKVFLVNALIAISMFVFFTSIAPLIPFDADDWLFCGTMRGPYPLWHGFNPTRVLPELLQPMVAKFASIFIYPFTRDYVGAIGVASALCVSLFIVVFLYSFYLFIKRRLKLSVNLSLLVELFFFLSFFLLFKHINQPSYTGFWTVDLTCVFFYLIPGLLNASLVLMMGRTSNFSHTFSQSTNVQKGIFVIITYFALLSNTQFNIILAVFCFCNLLAMAKEANYHIFSFSFLKKCWLQISILVVWLATVLFDLSGQRAKQLTVNQQITPNARIHIIGGQVKRVLAYSSRLFVLFALCLVIFAIVVAIVKKNNNFINFTVYMVLSVVLSGLYLLIAYYRAAPSYIGRIDAMWPVIFYFLLIVAFAFAYVINNFSTVKIVAPLVITCMIFISMNFSCPPILSMPQLDAGISTRTAKEIDQYIIQQVIKADNDGKRVAHIKVPKGSPTDNNWPQAYYMESALSQSLYSHGIINHRIQLVFEPSVHVNNKFNTKIGNQNFHPVER